jgi:glutamate-1-semialdehyde 2,1-aminomutase
MNLGVPEEVRRLTHSIPFNDLEALEAAIAEFPDQIAAMIMEPMTATWPNEGYLQAVREITAKHGIVLVFDEMLTGFRFAPGGAQEYFGVTPDLAAFGKALANGFPLSAIAGRADILNVMPRIFFSGTFGGETLSLAAAKVVLDRMKTGIPTDRLAELGDELITRIDSSRDARSKTFLEFSGHPSWIFLQWRIDDAELLAQAKTLFLQEMLRRGVLVLSTHDVTTAFDSTDLDIVADAYSESLSIVGAALDTGTMNEVLECEPIRPLFRVRS